jgi:hypothetical protein
MATVRPSGAGNEAVGTGAKNNGGTVINGGSNAAGIMTKNLSLSEIADNVGESFGSKVIAQVGTGNQYTQRVGISGAIPGSVVGGETVLGYQADSTEWVVKGGRVSVTLAGVANTTLIGGAAGPDPTRDSTNQLETTRTNGSLDLDVLAAPASGINSFRTITGGGVEKSYIDPAAGDGTTASTDSAANTTRSVPGELVYRTGAAVPKQDNYKSKETYES